MKGRCRGAVLQSLGDPSQRWPLLQNTQRGRMVAAVTIAHELRLNARTVAEHVFSRETPAQLACPYLVLTLASNCHVTAGERGERKVANSSLRISIRDFPPGQVGGTPSWLGQ